MSSPLCFATKCRYGFVSESKADELHPVLTRSIDIFDLSVRAREALRAGKIYYVGDLITKTETDLMRISRLKKEDINIIKSLLSKMDLRLGTNINWPSNREEVEALVKTLNPKTELTFVFTRSIDTLELSDQDTRSLKAREIYYIGDLVTKTEVILITWGMTKKSIISVIKTLEEIDLFLGLNIEWPSSRAEVEVLVQTLKSKDESPSTSLVTAPN